MPIIAVAAVDLENGIGKNNELLVRLEDDLRHFRDLTLGHTVLMGRKTYASIGRPLPHRTNVVLTRDAAFEAPGCVIYPSPEAVLDFYDPSETLFIIGGASIYEAFLPHADELYLTQIYHQFGADTFFPGMMTQPFKVQSGRFHRDKKTGIDFSIEHWIRR